VPGKDQLREPCTLEFTLAFYRRLVRQTIYKALLLTGCWVDKTCI